MFLRFFALFFLFLLIQGCDRFPPLENFSGTTMGTTYSIKYWSKKTHPPLDQVKQETERLLHEVNRQMSTYIPTSEISQFNSSRSTNWFPISNDFAYVVKRAIEIGNLTEGGYDITVGPLVDLWGFGGKSEGKKVPTNEQILNTKRKIGLTYLKVRPSPAAIMKSLPYLEIDLSSIAKGFGVDKVALYLESEQIDHYMVEIGGEIRTKGVRPKGEGWFIAIETPTIASQSIRHVVKLNNQSIATSGDYRNFFQAEGKTFSHTINPLTGRPITHQIGSVTIIASDCTTADGWATAINILGVEKGLELMKKNKIKGLIITREKEQFKEFSTNDFQTQLQR